MRSSLKLTVIIGVLALLQSCKNGTTGLLIPKDASIVIDISGSSLNSKLSWDDIRKSNWFNDVSEHDDTLTRKLLTNPDSSGLDLKSNYAFFIKNEGTGSYSAVEGNIKDPAAFESTVTQIHKDAKVETDGDMKYIARNNHLLTWTKTKFIFLANAPMMNKAAIYDMHNNNVNRFSADSLRTFSKQLYALKSSDAIEDNGHFRDLMKESGDIHLWFTSNFYSNTAAGGMASMLKMSDLFEGNVATSTLNFDDGKISIKWKQYYGDKMKAILDKYTYKNVTEDQVNRIPSQNVIGAMVGNFPPDVMKEILKASGLDGLANGLLGKYNYSLDELLQALKGEVVIAVTDFNQTKTMVTMPGAKMSFPRTSTSINVLFAFGLNNRASFDKLMGIVKQNIPDTAIWNKVKYKVDNNWFVIGNNASSVDGFFAGNNNHLPFASKISGHPFGGYVDIQKILKGFQNNLSEVSDSIGREALNISLGMWQDVVVTGGDYKNGIATADMVVNLVDKSTNSLKQLNKYVDQLHSLEKQRPHPEYTQPDAQTIIPSGGDLPSSTGR
jgi:hypothetical protein